ncbi:SLATT domain-containing protein [Nonomuraea sp. CA-218870]|uniref:SLATT domain-containing protein n=1 Tax=Nonomuraea corallina TaxID=2989783 RepID=A0ABT4SG10_9ACTN|nr:SLATT domain-containing protein [Nonomuraea corallina]MDA0635958.1 SLATT domain-containing protein [Nonomuraea corallina]
MSSSTEFSQAANIQAIRESFGRVVYSHKTHEKAREIESARAERAKWINIVLVTLTSGTLLTSVITDQRTLLYVSSVVSAAAFAFTIFQLSFNPEKTAEQHRAVAKELWYVREKYIHLLTDIQTDPRSVDIPRRRDELLEELKYIYRLAPDTSSKAYRAAQRALQINEDMTFSNEELNRFLPDALRLD